MQLAVRTKITNCFEISICQQLIFIPGPAPAAEPDESRGAVAGHVRYSQSVSPNNGLLVRGAVAGHVRYSQSVSPNNGL